MWLFLFMALTIPQLETDRLWLRAHEAGDLDRAFAMWSDERVVRFIGGKPSTRQASWSRLMTYRGHWEYLRFGYWAAVEKSSGLYIGDVGFADFKREMTPSIEGLPEMGWVFSPESHGKGYVSEATEAALTWASRELQPRFENVVCIIDPGNLPSLRIAEKNGFAKKQTARYLNEPVELFARKL